MDWQIIENWIESAIGYLTLVGAFCWVGGALLEHHHKSSQQSDAELQRLTLEQYHFLIWPAQFMNRVYQIYFGRVALNDKGKLGKTGWKQLYSFKSMRRVLWLSLGANLICCILILLERPKAFEITMDHIQVVFFSYLFFLFCNFWGDLISVNISRYVVVKIVHKGRLGWTLLLILLLDVAGIVIGYLVTLTPSLSITLYCWVTDSPFNEWIEWGVLGNGLIPFLLFLFATTFFSIPVTVFAVVAVLSVTIPTVGYLVLMLINYPVFRLIRHLNRKEPPKKQIEIIIPQWVGRTKKLGANILVWAGIGGGLLIFISF